MKAFVYKELDGQAVFKFHSDRTTSGMNMGQIVQIAFELKKLTETALDDESSDAEEDPMDDSKAELHQWFAFCKNKVQRIEKLWNRKLEDTEDEEEQEKTESKDDLDERDENDDAEALLSDMLANIPNNKSRDHLSKSFNYKSNKE